LKRKHNVAKLKRVQRLINIKIARAYRTISHEAFCVLIGVTPIQIELGSQAKDYYITRGNAQIDVPKYYRKWNHPAKAIDLNKKCEEREYTIEVYTGGSKSPSGLRIWNCNIYEETLNSPIEVETGGEMFQQSGKATRNR
jgi:hypothetical protein